MGLISEIQQLIFCFSYLKLKTRKWKKQTDSHEQTQFIVVEQMHVFSNVGGITMKSLVPFPQLRD